MKYLLALIISFGLILLPACEMWDSINRGIVGGAGIITDADTNLDGMLSLSEILALFGLGGAGVTVRNYLSARKKNKAFSTIEGEIQALKDLLAELQSKDTKEE